VAKDKNVNASQESADYVNIDDKKKLTSLEAAVQAYKKKPEKYFGKPFPTLRTIVDPTQMLVNYGKCCTCVNCFATCTSSQAMLSDCGCFHCVACATDSLIGASCALCRGIISGFMSKDEVIAELAASGFI
jgi:hypothetical protein